MKIFRVSEKQTAPSKCPINLALNCINRIMARTTLDFTMKLLVAHSLDRPEFTILMKIANSIYCVILEIIISNAQWQTLK